MRHSPHTMIARMTTPSMIIITITAMAIIMAQAIATTTIRPT